MRRKPKIKNVRGCWGISDSTGAQVLLAIPLLSVARKFIAYSIFYQLYTNHNVFLLTRAEDWELGGGGDL